jgi:hypothetical protein
MSEPQRTGELLPELLERIESRSVEPGHTVQDANFTGRNEPDNSTPETTRTTDQPARIANNNFASKYM